MKTELSGCRLCPRECGADRQSGERGFCQEGVLPVVARASLHMWEEPCISGERGSGTVFFSGCGLRCIYCQNHEIALGRRGREMSVSELAALFIGIQEKGAHNLNLVTPSHFAAAVRDALLLSKQIGLEIPVVYNCGGYEKPESLGLLDGLVDIYMPDFKYMEASLAEKFSHAADYPEAAKAAIAEMVRQTGGAVFDREGMMQKGTLIRHLLLPGHVENSKKVARYLLETYGEDVFISLMNQYTPVRYIEEYPELNRRVTKREYARLVDYALEAGLINGYIQEGAAAQESFIPSFD